jgi:integrase
MTVYLPDGCVSWRYDFHYKGERHWGSTEQTDRDGAVLFEANLKQSLRRRAAGFEPAGADDTPRFSSWAKVTYVHAVKKKQLKRPEQFATNLKMILGFWGARPRSKPVANAPYHDLRLGHPITDPEWIEKFEQWMDERGISGARKNHYRSACSMCYRVALLPANRKKAQVKENPFEHVGRDRVPKRIRTFTYQQLRAVIAAAPAHVKVALAIGALAPKLRLRNVLDLTWTDHVARDLSYITAPDHKTDRETGLPLIVPVSPELRKVLAAAQAQARGKYVVHYRGRGIGDIKTALKHAVQTAGKATKDRALVWGRAKGLTYHTLRHTMGTEFARMKLPDSLASRLMGHSSDTTTRIYRHLLALDEVEPLEALGVRMPVADLVIPSMGKPVRRNQKTRRKASKSRRVSTPRRTAAAASSPNKHRGRSRVRRESS